jgi:hypothetical protein
MFERFVRDHISAPWPQKTMLRVTNIRNDAVEHDQNSEIHDRSKCSSSENHCWRDQNSSFPDVMMTKRRDIRE